MSAVRTLRSDRLELRRLDGGDAAFVESLYASAKVTRTLLRIQQAISFEEAREFCLAPVTACGDHRFGAALRADGKLIALGSVRRHTELPGTASIGYSVLGAFWGQGFGTELAALLVEFAMGTLGVSEVRATTLDDNPASARVLEKLGFAVLEVGATEVDSRGDERHVTRWFLHRRGERAEAAG
ncbi:MAG TPA: GNAT family N-acetyltransferase [Myxococcaceae bacterium]|nr:GNAT family N-acetyltransferase [Myxococcaceae bacterium]